MLTNFSIGPNGNLEPTSGANPIIWTDAFRPTQEERDALEKETQAVLPLHNEMHQIEYSNRFYEENGVLYLSVNIVTRVEPMAEIHVVTFILTPQRLITLRYTDPSPVRTFINKLAIHPQAVKNHGELFVLLIETFVGSIADIFELVDMQTDTLTATLMGTMNQKSEATYSKLLNKSLHKINYLENIASKCSQSLSSMVLLLGYLRHLREKNLQLHHSINLEITQNDLTVLLKHGDFLTQKLSFLLQLVLGKINMEQTYIIKIFTILAMVLMPPTLIASIYGMNFHIIPELSFTYGYPMALCAMLISAFVPYRVFKKKGWV